MATKTTKLAGPDRNGNYKVLAVKGHLEVKPGELYAESNVRNMVGWTRIETTIIEPKFDSRETRKVFLGSVTAF